MGRTMPTECEHGNVIDWGDFGPHPDGCPGMDGDYRQDPYCVGCFPVCPKCEGDDATRTGLTVECDVCGDELADPGALIFSPPQTIRGQDMTFPAMTQKFHICSGCWTDEVQHVVMPDPPNRWSLEVARRCAAYADELDNPDQLRWVAVEHGQEAVEANRRAAADIRALVAFATRRS